MKIVQLGVGHVSWRGGEQALRGGRLRERDDVPDGLGPREHHDQPVQPEGHPAVRRRPELERLHQVAKLLLRLLFA